MVCQVLGSRQGYSSKDTEELHPTVEGITGAVRVYSNIGVVRRSYRVNMYANCVGNVYSISVNPDRSTTPGHADCIPVTSNNNPTKTSGELASGNLPGAEGQRAASQDYEAVATCVKCASC